MLNNKVNEKNEGVGESPIKVSVYGFQPDEKGKLMDEGAKEYETMQFGKGQTSIKFIPNTPEDVRKRQEYKKQKATGESVR